MNDDAPSSHEGNPPAGPPVWPSCDSRVGRIWQGYTVNPRTRALDSQLYAGIAAFRSAAWVWMVIVAAISASRLTAPLIAWGIIGVAGLVTLWQLRLAWDRGVDGVSRIVLLVDLATGVALLVADGWVYQDGRPQSLAAAWPVAPVLAIGVALGTIAAVSSAAVLGAARFVGLIGMAGAPAQWQSSELLSVLSTAVLYALAGWAAATVARRLRQAEDLAAQVAARERVARDLHDGMLQTLAAVQRRANDPTLVHLARAQESELRTYLFTQSDARTPAGNASAHGGDAAATTMVNAKSLEAKLRAVAAQTTARWGLAVQQAYVATPTTMPSALADAVAAAAGECLANVAKHAGVTTANVLVEGGTDHVNVVVRDRGAGFAVDATTVRGLQHSVIERIQEVGGTVTITSTPGRGTEIQLRVPTR